MRNPDASCLLIVDDPGSAEALVRWSVYQARSRGSSLEVVYSPGLGCPGQHRMIDEAAIALGRKELTETVEQYGIRSQGDLVLAPVEPVGAESVRAKALDPRYSLVIVGPLPTSVLLILVFGSSRLDGDHKRGLPLVVVPRPAWSANPPDSAPSTLTVGFDGRGPAVAALAWAINEADRRDGAVRAVMAWSEGDYGGLGGSVSVVGGRSSTVGRSADRLAVESLSRSRLPPDRVTSVGRRGMPASVLLQEADASDLLVVGAGQSTVHGYRRFGTTTCACVHQSRVPVVLVPGARLQGDR